MNTQQLQYNYRTTQQNLANLHFKLLQAKIIKVTSHLETPANGQAVVFLTGLLEVFISEISFRQQYRTTLSVIKPYKSGQIKCGT